MKFQYKRCQSQRNNCIHAKENNENFKFVCSFNIIFFIQLVCIVKESDDKSTECSPWDREMQFRPNRPVLTRNNLWQTILKIYNLFITHWLGDHYSNRSADRQYQNSGNTADNLLYKNIVFRNYSFCLMSYFQLQQFLFGCRIYLYR